MDRKEISDSIAYCGLICGLCQPAHVCHCKSENHCGKRLSKEGCFQYQCCREKGLEGCWECELAPCGKDMLAEDKIKLRAFIRCMKEDGLENFDQAIKNNAEQGIVYHRKGIYGDYDLETEEEVLALLRQAMPVK